MFCSSWKICTICFREKSSHASFLHPSIHNSVGRAEWKWVGQINSDWWAVKKTTNSDKYGYIDIDITCLQMQMIGVGKYANCFGRNPAMFQTKRWYHLSANADYWVWQMHNNPTNKSIYQQCANTDILAGPLLLHAYAGRSCHRDNYSYWRRLLIVIIWMIKLCEKQEWNSLPGRMVEWRIRWLSGA